MCQLASNHFRNSAWCAAVTGSTCEANMPDDLKHAAACCTTRVWRFPDFKSNTIGYNRLLMLHPSPNVATCTPWLHTCWDWCRLHHQWLGSSCCASASSWASNRSLLEAASDSTWRTANLALANKSWTRALTVFTKGVAYHRSMEMWGSSAGHQHRRYDDVQSPSL